MFRTGMKAACTRHCLTLILASALATTSAAAQAAEPDNGGWRFAVTPYLWLPEVNTKLGFDPPPAGGGNPTVESGADSYLSNLDMVVMLGLEARKGEWAIFSDFIYLHFSNDDASMKIGNGPAQVAVSSNTRSEVKGGLWQLAGSYAVARSDRSTFEVLGGVRYLTVRAEADWRLAGPAGLFPQSGSASKKEELWDGIVGVRGRLGLGEGRWFAPYYLDAGAGSSDLTWQALAGIGYAFDWGDVLLTYRHLSYEQGSGNLIQELTFSGPALGATFRF